MDTSIFLVSGILIFAIQFIKYFDNYHNKYPYIYSQSWQYGYKEVVDYISENQDKYDVVVMSRVYGEPQMFTLFFQQYDPERFQNDPNLVRNKQNDWVFVSNFDKYYFPHLGEEGTKIENAIEKYPDKKLLIVGSPDEIPDGMKELKRIDFLDGKTAFIITEVM